MYSILLQTYVYTNVILNDRYVFYYIRHWQEKGESEKRSNIDNNVNNEEEERNRNVIKRK